MTNSSTRLLQSLTAYYKLLKARHSKALMSTYLQLELPFTMASETAFVPLRHAQLNRAAKTRQSLKGN